MRAVRSFSLCNLPKAGGVRWGSSGSRSPVPLHFVTVSPSRPSEEDDTAPPFVVVHGMLGNANNWRTPAKLLAEGTGRKVHCVDLRNHGRSPHTEAMSLGDLAGDLNRFAQEVVRGKAVMLGHSLGGKAVMRAALEHPEAVSGLVVADIAPVDYMSSRRKAASQSLKYIRLLRSMEDHIMRDLRKADAFLKDSGVSSLGVRQFLLTNLARNASERKVSWRANLPVIEESLAAGRLIKWDCGGHPPCSSPAFVVAGGRSPYVDRECDAPAFAKHFPNHEFHTVDDAGHWVHAERPQEFTDAVISWIRNAEGV